MFLLYPLPDHLDLLLHDVFPLPCCVWFFRPKPLYIWHFSFLEFKIHLQSPLMPVCSIGLSSCPLFTHFTVFFYKEKKSKCSVLFKMRVFQEMHGAIRVLGVVGSQLLWRWVTRGAPGLLSSAVTADCRLCTVKECLLSVVNTGALGCDWNSRFDWETARSGSPVIFFTVLFSS